MFNIKKDKDDNLVMLEITRGDTCNFICELYSPIDNTPYILMKTDSAKFIVKKFNTDIQPILSIDGNIITDTNIITFALKGTDTFSMDLGKYLCSIVLILANNEKYTVVYPKCDNQKRYIPNMELCLNLDDVESQMSPNIITTYSHGIDKNKYYSIKGIVNYPNQINIKDSILKRINGGNATSTAIRIIHGGYPDSVYDDIINGGVS